MLQPTPRTEPAPQRLLQAIYRYLAVYSTVSAVVLVVVLAIRAVAVGDLARAMPFVLLFFMAVGWVLYTYFRYRFARQEELLHVLATAVEADLPLVPAIRAFVRDRPIEGRWGWFDVSILFAVPPGYWLWRQRDRFDRRAEELADALEEGHSLTNALRSVRGAAPRA